MKKYLTIIILTICLLIGGFLRTIHFTKNPISLNIDEINFGYSAYSILKTGRDEYGVFMPISFQSTGDYKNPVPVYLKVPFIYLSGLNEFSVRLPNVIFGTFGILVFYYLFLSLVKNKTIALTSTALSAISAWHIYFSRYSYEGLIAITFVCLGMIFLLRIFENKFHNSFFSAFFFILSMYTYYTERIFVPLIVIVFLFFNLSKLKKHSKSILIFLGFCFIFSIPLLYSTLFGPDSARLKMVFIGNDIEFTRNYVSSFTNSNTSIDLINNQNLYLFFFCLQRYINYFDPGFFFFNGLNMTLPGTVGLGILYIFELPFLIIGIVEIFKKKLNYGYFLLAWIVIGFFPASITNNEYNAGRALVAIPALLLIVGTGAVSFVSWLKNLKQPWKYSIFTAYCLLIFLTLFHAFLVFKVHYPFTRGEDFMEGTKESIQYALANRDEYDEIVLDPYRGVQAGDIFNIPDMYLLFYSAYDPAKLQKLKANFNQTGTKIDKFTIRKIYWPDDRSKKNTLYIGSPWSLNLKDLKEEQILKKIYLTNGQLALLIVKSEEQSRGPGN